MDVAEATKAENQPGRVGMLVESGFDVFPVVESLANVLGGTLLFRRNRVGGDSIIAILEPGDAGCDQFFVRAGQRAISHEWFQERDNTLRQRRSMGDGLEHVGHYAPLLKESVVDGADLGRDLIAL